MLRLFYASVCACLLRMRLVISMFSMVSIIIIIIIIIMNSNLQAITPSSQNKTPFFVVSIPASASLPFAHSSRPSLVPPIHLSHSPSTYPALPFPNPQSSTAVAMATDGSKRGIVTWRAADSSFVIIKETPGGGSFYFHDAGTIQELDLGRRANKKVSFRYKSGKIAEKKKEIEEVKLHPTTADSTSISAPKQLDTSSSTSLVRSPASDVSHTHPSVTLPTPSFCTAAAGTVADSVIAEGFLRPRDPACGDLH